MELTGKFGFKKTPNLSCIESALFKFFDKLSYKLLRVTHLSRFGSAPSSCNESSKAMPDLENALVFKFAIDLNHSVRIDYEVFR